MDVIDLHLRFSVFYDILRNFGFYYVYFNYKWMNDWMNDEKMDAIEWMDVWINEGMKKIKENWVSAMLLVDTNPTWLNSRRC